MLTRGRRKRSPRFVEIAVGAGLSPSTVDRVLNERGIASKKGAAESDRRRAQTWRASNSAERRRRVDSLRCFASRQQDAFLSSAAGRHRGACSILDKRIVTKTGPLRDETIARALAELYDAGLKPDWWKLKPQASVTAWQAIDTVIAERDPYCRGVVLLGLDSPIEALKDSFVAAQTAGRVRGFAVGRTIFAEAAGRG